MNAIGEIVVSNALLVVILAAVIAVVGRFWKNPAGLHLLWLLVLLKFITPPLLTVPIHLPSRPIAVETKPTATPSPSDEIAFPAIEKVADSEARLAPPSFDPEPIAGANKTDAAPLPTSIPWLGILAGLWGIGIVTVAAWQAFRILRFHRLLHSAQPATGDVLSMAAEIGKQLGLRRTPQIRMLPVRVSPMVLSVGIRPQLLLPVELFKRLETSAQRSLLAHELAHVRRKDHLVRLLELLVTTLFWWHPVAWWACWELQKLEDLCCDSMVVGLMPGSKKVYATALMNTLDFLCDGSIAAPLGLTATQSSALLTRRIAMMKNRSGVMRLTVGRIVLLVLVAAVPMSIAFAAKPLKSDVSNSAKAGATVEDASQPTVVVPSQDNSADLAPVTPSPAIPKVNDQSGKTSAAKPADEVSPASDQPATKEGAKTELKPAPAHGLTAEANAEQAKAIAEIEKLGGNVTVDEKSPGKPVISVDLQRTKVTDEGMECLTNLNQLTSLNLTATNVTNAGLANLEVLSQLQQLFLNDTKVTDAGLDHLKNLNQLHKLHLRNTEVTDAGLVHIKGLTQLKWLDIGGTQITNAGLVHLEVLSQLQQLFLNDTKVTDAGLDHLKVLAKLQWLYLGNTKVSDAGLKHIRGLTQLVFLGLYETNVTDAGLEHVEVLTQLRGLQLEGPTITDAGLQRLKGLSQLQHLTLRNTQVTDAGLKHLKGLTQLVVLVLDGTKVTDDGLEHLKGLTRLTCLLLKGTKVTDAGLKCLTGLTQFKELDLNGTKVTDAGLEYLTGMIQLRELELNETKVTDAGLKHLTGLTHLQQLGLNGTKVTDAGLEHLKGLTHLLALRLDGTKITDAGLEHLEGLTQLGELYLTSTKVTDAGLEHLKGLAQLKILQLAGTPVTDEGVKKLQQALPNCKISR